MKTFIKISLGILYIAIAVAIIYFGWFIGVPYITAKSQYTKDLPTIQGLEHQISVMQLEKDSLSHRIEYLEQEVALQNRLIEERNLQSTISQQLRNLQNSYNETKH